MWMIVGLGNPGRQYAQTRHNVGFMVIDALAKVFPTSPLYKHSWFHVLQATVHQHAVLFVTPQLFMNRSGIAVQEALRQYDESPDHLVVVSDDLDLPVGRLRIRKQGGHGGHKGVHSIIDCLQTRQFLRLRIGIGRPDRNEEGGSPSDNGIVDYVLQPFEQDEQSIIAEVIDRAVHAIALIVDQHIETAMNQYNR